MRSWHVAEWAERTGAALSVDGRARIHVSVLLWRGASIQRLRATTTLIFTGHKRVLVMDAGATFSPAFCPDAVSFPTMRRYGFVTTSADIFEVSQVRSAETTTLRAESAGRR